MSYATSPNLGMPSPSQGQAGTGHSGLVLTLDFQPVSILAVLAAAGVDVSRLPMREAPRPMPVPPPQPETAESNA